MGSRVRLRAFLAKLLLLAALAPSCGGGGGGGGGGASPAPPGSVVATPSDGAVTLTWGAAVGATSYNVYMATQAGVTKATYASLPGGMLHPGVSSPFVHLGLANGTTYYFAVTALNGSGESAESAEAWAIPSATAPPLAPTGVAASPGIGSITLSWSASAGATGYNVYMATQAGVTKATYASLPGGMLHAGVTSPFLHTGLTNGTTYYFVVTALNAWGESAESVEVSAAPTAPPCPPTVITPPVQGTLVPITGTLRELVYDPVRNRVYVTNYDNNRLEIYDIGSGTLLSPLTVGSQPWGLDLTPDNSRLLVCLTGASQIPVIDVTANPPAIINTLTVPTDTSGTNQARTIGCASNNLAFYTCVYPGSGWSVPRQIDLGTWTTTFRTDMELGQTTDPTWIGVSQDRSRLVFAEGNTPAGSITSTLRRPTRSPILTEDWICSTTARPPTRTGAASPSSRGRISWPPTTGFTHAWPALLRALSSPPPGTAPTAV